MTTASRTSGSRARIVPRLSRRIAGARTVDRRPSLGPASFAGAEYEPKRRTQRYCSRTCAAGGGKRNGSSYRRVDRPPHDELLGMIDEFGYLGVGRDLRRLRQRDPQVGAGLRAGAGDRGRARSGCRRDSASGPGPTAGAMRRRSESAACTRRGTRGRSARPLYDSPVAGPTVLIMAAGEGTRMRSSLPKMMHPVCGRPMVAWPVAAAREAGAGRVAVIVSPDRDLSEVLPDGTETVVQPEADGTGGAIRAALDLVRDAETVVVVPGDHPLISGELLAELLAAHAEADAAATVMSVELDDPGAYGRLVRTDDGAGRPDRRDQAPRDRCPPRSSRSARSPPAPSPSTPARSPPRSSASPTTTTPASTTSATSCRCCAPTASPSPPTCAPTRPPTSASTTAPTSRSPPPRPAAASRSATCSPG